MRTTGPPTTVGIVVNSATKVGNFFFAVINQANVGRRHTQESLAGAVEDSTPCSA